MKLIIKETDYAMRALVFMGKNRNSLYNVREISEELKISHQYLRRILQVLSRNGILKSLKGKNGGFILNKDPGKIFLVNLIDIFQGSIDIKHCMVGTGICPNNKSCLLSRNLEKMQNIIKKDIGALSIETLIRNKITAKK
jgi:Rrf2 family protein